MVTEGPAPRRRSARRTEAGAAALSAAISSSGRKGARAISRPPSRPPVAPASPPDPAERARAGRILARLRRAYPDARCALDFQSPLDLYVATVLSAQCTDERVNLVTPALFARCRTPEDYLALGPAALEAMIHSTGFFRAKAKSILGACRVLLEEFDGRIPGTMEELRRLPGVGRKTANVILGEAFGVPGITVDTHVSRLAGRLGLTEETDPVKIEFALMPLFPRKEWTRLSHRLIRHGRVCCQARKPDCPACPIRTDCPFPARLATASPSAGSAQRRPARNPARPAPAPTAPSTGAGGQRSTRAPARSQPSPPRRGRAPRA